MLDSIRIQEFKSYMDATLELSPLTILIGANASGKSNAIEALKLLSWIAQGNTLSSIASTIQEQSHMIRGVIKELGYHGKDRFKFTCNGSDASWSKYKIRLEATADGQLLIDDEELRPSKGTSPFFRAYKSISDTGALELAYNTYGGRERIDRTICSNQMSAIVQLDSPALIESKYKAARKKIPSAASECRDELRKLAFIDPRPSEMRGYSFHNQRSLYENGSNISGILYQLCKDPKTKEMIVGFVKSLPEQEIDDIGFIETERDDVMVTLAESFGGERRNYDASLLSDGTLRVLAAAAAVLSAPKGSLVVVEEIDSGVHPGRAIHLLEKLANVANSRELRILISTHNPALLDGLPVGEISNVMVSYRNPDTGASELIRMGDIQNFPILVAGGKIGHLMTEGRIDAFIKKNPGPEENRRQARSWIELFHSPESQDS